MPKIFLSFFLFYSFLSAQHNSSLHEQVKALEPKEAIKTIQVPKGYKLQLVASEPMITEPVDCVWDANGDMYVIEMKTYMQDADATGQFEKSSRVMKLTDTDGDGSMDKSSVFIDGLILPRMILPLDNRILVCETNTLNIYAYSDTNGDGRADKKTLWFQGGKISGNMEHQASGLIWNIDNWIYMTKSELSFKIVDGKPQKGNRGFLNGQWGLHHDDDGNLATGFSGMEKSFEYFQHPTVYGMPNFPNELEKDFNIVWPIDKIPDTQAGPRRLRADHSLNHFTAACGHTVYRGELMPEFYGNYLVAEPVGRLVRMAKVDTSLGFKQMRNVYPKSEFIRSSDANFRPVNLKTGPDGALYIVDMYRGVIQEANWTKKGTYLRKIIDQYGLAKNIQRGRIYRLIPEGYTGRNIRPNILSKDSAELITLLAHTNGWVRSTARKILILRNDKHIIPQLKSILKNSVRSRERIEVLWTLEGLQALNPAFVLPLLKSSDERLAVHALRTMDPWLQSRHPEVLAAYEEIFITCTSEKILTQAFLSMKKFGQTHSADFLKKFMLKYQSHPMLKYHFDQWEREKEAYQRHLDKMAALKGKGALFNKIMRAGEKHYKSLCFACHGTNGEGTPMAGTSITLAPPLKASPRVLGDKDTLIKITLHGLTGPLDGKNYPGSMESLAAHNNQYISEVLTYIRNSWGNGAEMINSTEVHITRSQNATRKHPWTIQELNKK